MKNRQVFILVLLFILAIALTFSQTIVHIITEAWWFDAVGFSDVFWTRITWQVVVWVTTFVVYALFLWGNFAIAMRLTRDRPFYVLQHSRAGRYITEIPNYVVFAIVFVIALGAAMANLPLWETTLKFFNPTTFDVSDPIYQNDVGFYMFRLPFYESLRSSLIALVIWGLVFAAGIYGLKGVVSFRQNWAMILTGNVKIHLSLLLAGIALLVAIGFWLDRYELLYSPEGVVFGAGYTDVHARLQSYWIMGVLTLLLAAVLIASIWQRGFALPIISFMVYTVTLVLIGGGYPWFQQQFIVEPNELAKEQPYIAHNIEFTRKAYQLDAVQREDFPANAALDRQALDQNQSTVRNIRLWDYRPLLSTYRQLQEIRLYYRFLDVDVDRYTLDGSYRQVMLSARELVNGQLPQEAQTWVNRRLKYTHGYGLVMSPVNVVTPDGLPEFFVQDIPPRSQVDLEVTQPGIYYGEATTDYVFTGTTTDEFDYPQGGENAATRYDGQGGVFMSSIWQRLAYAYDLGSIKILISNYFTNGARIHYHRAIRERVNQVAPFLKFDNDPYVTVVDGRLQWVIDAYTVSDRYPYSEPLVRSNNAGAVLGGNGVAQIVQGNVNYIRNSVKVVVDAYDGTMQFFVVDDTDPLLKTYSKIFPGLFTPANETPDTVKAHFRYPLDFFKVQAQMYLSYHMNTPEVFYNREDLWRFPTEVYEGTQQLVEPYYVIMRLPGSDQEEFMLILPFTPVNKDNMIAWMAARSDREHYGTSILYEFPKQELVYGPSQIEARIDQNPEISQQLTLWSQEGSRVIRGDLLVIPIEQSVLYVEPVYLRAEQGELPELRRVIAAFASQTVMANSLEEALAVLFGESQAQPEAPTPLPGEAPTPAVPTELRARAAEALEAYQNAQNALRQGDWASYGEYQQELERLLEQLSQGE
jgi:uncharacterized membrane protein (UPF0182 family)